MSVFLSPWIVVMQILVICWTDLISAPVPGGLNGESKHKAGPRQVSCDRIPKNMEGIGPRLVAARTDVSRDGGDGLHVALLEALIASHLMESCVKVRFYSSTISCHKQDLPSCHTIY